MDNNKQNTLYDDDDDSDDEWWWQWTWTRNEFILVVLFIGHWPSKCEICAIPNIS